MKRWTYSICVCSFLSVVAFCALLVQDRRLGVPLPYSFLLAGVLAHLLGIAALFTWDKLGTRWQPVRQLERLRPLRPAAHVEGVHAEGFVLLQLGTPVSSEQRAA